MQLQAMSQWRKVHSCVHIFFRVTWERVHREKRNSSQTEIGIIASSLAMFYFQLSHTRYVVRWISWNSQQLSLFEVHFCVCNGNNEFLQFFSMLLFIFSLRFVLLFGSICTLGLSFPEIFAIWFLCVAFVPTKVNLHTKGSDNDDGFWASNPSTPLCAGRKLIFRRISHFTSVWRLYIFLVVLSSSELLCCCVTENLNISLCMLSGRRRRSFLLIIFLPPQQKFVVSEDEVCSCKVSWCELSEMNNFIIFQTWKWLFEFVKIFVLLSHRASPRLMTKLF